MVECTRPIDGDQQKGSALRAWFCIPEGILSSATMIYTQVSQPTLLNVRSPMDD
ncbi:MAG: hypothetical protein ACE37L_13770 [Allomuricauda sp.]